MPSVSRHDPPRDRPPVTRPPRLSVSTGVTVAVLLAIPCVALALVPIYSRTNPSVLGFPFFYWYQLVWVILTPILTWSAYLLVKRGRRQ